MSEFVVHGIPGSPYVRSALLGLEEKGIPYRLAAIDFGQQKTADYLARQPFGLIPAFEHGAFKLYETQAMLRYLDELVPEPSWLPKDIQARARMNQLIGICDFHVRPMISGAISFERLMVPKLFGGVSNEEKIAAALPNAKTCVVAIEALAGDTFMAGDALSIADLMLAPHFSYFALTPEGQALMGPKLTGWIARMEGRSSMRATGIEKLLAGVAKAA